MDVLQFTVVVAVSTLDIGLGVAVLQRNRHSRTHRLFAATAAALALWMIANFMSDQPALYPYALFLNRATVAAGAVVAGVMLAFGATYPKVQARLSWLWRVLISFSVPLALLSFTPLMVQGIEFMSWGTNVILGPLYAVFVAWGFVCLALLALTFYRNFREADARQQAQLAYLYIGLAAFATSTIMITGILPILTGTNEYARFIPLATLAFLLPTAYAIARHRLLDVNFVVLRGAAYSIIVGLAGALVVAIAEASRESISRATGIESEIVVFVIALLAVLGFQPLRRWLERAGDRFLSSRTYDPDVLLGQLGRQVTATLDLGELSTVVATRLAHEMRLSFTAVIYTHSGGHDVVTSGGQVPTADLAGLLEHVPANDIIVVDELDELTDQASAFAQAGVRVVVPLTANSIQLGAVLLGEKSTGKMFSEQDVRFLTILASQIAVSMRNARLFYERNQRVSELVALNQLATTLGADIGLQTVIETALAEVAKVTGADTGSIMLLEKETGTLSVAASHGLPAGDGGAPSDVHMGDGISGWVAASRRALVLVDENDPRLVAEGRGGVASAITAPVIFKDEVIGVINLNRIGPGEPFSSDSLNVVTSFAGQLAVAIQNARLYDDLESTFIGTISALAAAVDAKDPHTYGHSNEVTDHAVALAERIGLPASEVDTVRLAALLHDIGKIGIDGAILNKPGALTDEERHIINHHPTIGADILAPLSFLNDVVPLILFHHERPDGKGYPSGISGAAIPIGARIISIADSYNAMVSDRPYREGLSETAARRELADNAGTQFDAELVEAYLQILAERSA